MTSSRAAARSPEAAAAAIEDNSMVFWRAVCGHIPDAFFHDDGEAAWFTTGIPFFPFNQVLRFSTAAQRADAAIDDVLAAFRAHGLPFCWNVGPASEPFDLAARLGARHPDRTGSMPAMALDLATSSAPAAHRAAIKRVRGAADIDRWAVAYRDAFGLSQRFVDAMRDVYTAVGLDDAAAFRHFVAVVDDVPVACSTMFRHRGIASLWHIATMPDLRRRGIGAAMTLAPIEDARALGCHTAVLYASEMGAPLYQRLGFREVSRLQQYGWGEGL